jgi:uncharacterized membrane protein
MKRWGLFLLLCITLIGAGLRLYRLDEKSLWSDEIATIATSMGNSIDPVAFTQHHKQFDPPQPIPAGDYLKKATQSHSNGNLTQVAQVTEILKDNVHPPLFFWLMHWWIQAVGLNAGLLRIPAVLFGILCIPAIYWLAVGVAGLNEQTKGEALPMSASGKIPLALLSAMFMAISVYQIDHAQDARQYTLLLLLAIMAIGVAVRIAQKKPTSVWPWLALALLLLAGLYTQYFFLNIILLVFGYLTWTGRRNRPFLARLIGTGVVVGIGFLPWWPIFTQQLVFVKAAGHYTAGLWKPMQLPEKLWRIACEFFMPDNPLGKIIPLLVLLVALGSGYTQRNNGKGKYAGLSTGLSLLLAWLAVVMGGQVAIDIIKHSHTATIRRYLLLASPACYLLMAYGIVFIGQRMSRQWGWLTAGTLSILLCGFMLADTNQQLRANHTSSDEFKQSAAWINQSTQANDVVLVSKSGAMAVGMAYYLKPGIRMRGIDVPEYRILMNDTPLMQQLCHIVQAKPSPRIWLIFSHEAPSTRERLTAWLAEQGYHSHNLQKVPGVTTQLWEQ